MRPSKAVVLFDNTSAANTAFDTGVLNVADFDTLSVTVLPSGAAAASTLSFYDNDLSASSAVRSMATPATAAIKQAAWGPGEVSTANGEYVGAAGGALPPNVKIGIGSLGVGITARIRVVGRRYFKEAIQPLDPVTHAPVEA